ncbi:MAG: hypothetical protein AB7E32_09525 [Desulfovibrio sp.]
MAGRETSPALQGGMEILRRAFCLGLLLTGAWFFLTPAEQLLRFSLPDLRAQYERNAVLHGEVVPGFGDWLERTLENRTLTVSGPDWAKMASALETLDRSGNVPAELPKRLARHLDKDGDAFWFAADDPLVLPLRLPEREFRYLLAKDTPQARPLGASYMETRHARGAPDQLRHPRRALAPWLLLAALAAYLLPPRPARHEGAARYGTVSAVLLPDLLGMAMTLFFFSLPLLIVGSTTDPGELLSLDRGWAYMTWAFWGLALICTSLPATAARYACFEARALPEGLELRTLWKRRLITYADVEEARAYDGAKRARLLSRLLLIFGGGMPQAVGLALLLTRNVEWGLELRLGGGESTRLMCNSLRNAGSLLSALAEAGIAVPETLRKACAEA